VSHLLWQDNKSSLDKAVAQTSRQDKTYIKFDMRKKRKKKKKEKTMPKKRTKRLDSD
jgi:hypothetical protein